MQKKQFFVSLMNRGCLFEYLSIRFFLYTIFLHGNFYNKTQHLHANW